MSPRLASLPTGHVLGRRVAIADRPRARLLGLALLGREQAGAGLHIPNCRSVHTCGMRFPLDIVFLDRHGAELRRIEGVPPNRVVAERRADSVLELPAAASPPRPRRRLFARLLHP